MACHRRWSTTVFPINISHLPTCIFKSTSLYQYSGDRTSRELSETTSPLYSLLSISVHVRSFIGYKKRHEWISLLEAFILTGYDSDYNTTLCHFQSIKTGWPLMYFLEPSYFKSSSLCQVNTFFCNSLLTWHITLPPMDRHPPLPLLSYVTPVFESLLKFIQRSWTSNLGLTTVIWAWFQILFLGLAGWHSLAAMVIVLQLDCTGLSGESSVSGCLAERCNAGEMEVVDCWQKGLMEIRRKLGPSREDRKG